MSSQDFRVQELELFCQMVTRIGILPSFDDSEIYLMTGQISAFKANHQTTVPLWLAFLLKRQQKCKIIPPFWMKVDVLQELYTDENADEELKCLHLKDFFQISYAILNKAPDDIQNSNKIRNLIDGLKDIRQKKIKVLMEKKNSFKIRNITTYEANKFRHVKILLSKQAQSVPQK